MDFLLVAFGLVALTVGGGWLVTGAVGVASTLRLSPLVIGVTIVGMGTSLPELVTSVRAALAGAPDLALGNVVGSNIANILLILGLAALLRPVPVSRAIWRGDLAVLAALSLFGAVWLALAGGIGRVGGSLFLAVLALWLVVQLRSGGDADAPAQTAIAPAKAALLIFGGLAFLMLGAEALVRGGTGLARAFGVSEAVIGLTVVAVGTSLPELATSLVAARAGRPEVALGNVLGSDVFNLLFILGTTAAVQPIALAPRFAVVDLPAMVGAVLALGLLTLRGSLLRTGGAVLLAGYGGYLAMGL